MYSQGQSAFRQGAASVNQQLALDLLPLMSGPPSLCLKDCVNY